MTKTRLEVLLSNAIDSILEGLNEDYVDYLGDELGITEDELKELGYEFN